MDGQRWGDWPRIMDGQRLDYLNGITGPSPVTTMWSITAKPRIRDPDSASGYFVLRYHYSYYSLSLFLPALLSRHILSLDPALFPLSSLLLHTCYWPRQAASRLGLDKEYGCYAVFSVYAKESSPLVLEIELSARLPSESQGWNLSRWL